MYKVMKNNAIIILEIIQYSFKLIVTPIALNNLENLASPISSYIAPKTINTSNPTKEMPLTTFTMISTKAFTSIYIPFRQLSQ